MYFQVLIQVINCYGCLQHGYIQNLQSWAVYKYAKHNLVCNPNWLWICFSRPRDWNVRELKTLKNQVHNANSDFIHTKKREKNPWDQTEVQVFLKKKLESQTWYCSKARTKQHQESLSTVQWKSACLCSKLEIGLHIITFHYFCRDESIFLEGEILFWCLNVTSATTWQFWTN